MAKKKEKWIPRNLKEGAFTAWCKRQGFNGVTEECIRKGLSSDNPTIRRRANLAKTFRKMRGQ